MTAATTTNKHVTVMASDDMRAWVPVKELKLSNYNGYISKLIYGSLNIVFQIKFVNSNPEARDSLSWAAFPPAASLQHQLRSGHARGCMDLSQ